jgi:polyhydroxyalkanoate synthase
LFAVQHKHAPRPLPLFLELVRTVGERDPKLASAALEGLAKYESAARPGRRRERPIVAQQSGATLRDCGGSGAPVVLVPSLINPPEILDLDERVSLADAIAATGRHALLLDWGPASERRNLSLGGHVEQLLAPLLCKLGEPPALVGYCLGGTMAIAAANVTRCERVAALAAPWRFSAYPEASRSALLLLWENARAAADSMGALPMEVLQGAFWSLDPQRTVAKFAAFADEDADSDRARRFVTLEDWANEGEPLPAAAARELVEDLFGKQLTECEEWSVGGKVVTDSLDCPLLNVTAAHDKITPAAAGPANGRTVQVGAGHVGMIVGSKRGELHKLLNDFLAGNADRR